MKITFLFLIILNGFFSFSQENVLDNQNNTSALPKEALFILDKHHRYRDPIKFPTVGDTSFMHILNGYVIMSLNLRGGSKYSGMGKIYDAKMEPIDGVNMLTFEFESDTLFSDSYSRKRVLVGVDFKKPPHLNRIFLMINNKVIIDVFHAHEPYEGEIIKLEEKSYLYKLFRETVLELE
ncbi:MAG: hypothetical protein V4622_06880 [Bacteroidota bacterium]